MKTWLVWCPDRGDDVYELKEGSAEAAALSWAERDDARGDYDIVKGSEVVVAVQEKGASIRQVHCRRRVGAELLREGVRSAAEAARYSQGTPERAAKDAAAGALRGTRTMHQTRLRQLLHELHREILAEATHAVTTHSNEEERTCRSILEI